MHHVFMHQQTDCFNNSDLNLMIMVYIHSLQTMFGPSGNVCQVSQIFKNFEIIYEHFINYKISSQIMVFAASLEKNQKTC